MMMNCFAVDQWIGWSMKTPCAVITQHNGAKFAFSQFKPHWMSESYIKVLYGKKRVQNNNENKTICEYFRKNFLAMINLK